MISRFQWILWSGFFVFNAFVGAVVLIAWPFADTSKYDNAFAYGHPLKVGADCLLMAYLSYFAFVKHKPSRWMPEERR